MKYKVKFSDVTTYWDKNWRTIEEKNKDEDHPYGWAPQCLDWGEPECWACKKFYATQSNRLRRESDCESRKENPKLEKGKTFQPLNRKIWHEIIDKHYKIAGLKKHYVLPLIHGGKEEPSNVAFLCTTCKRKIPKENNEKENWKWIKNYRQNLFNEIKELTKQLNL